MKFSKLLLIYGVSFIVGTGIFIDLFHTGLFGFLDVFFYRGIALLLVACTVVAVVLLIYWKQTHGIISLKDIYSIVLTLFSVNLLFFTHVPVTGERSVSVFLLGYMNTNANRVITKEELTDVFLRTYIGTDDNIQKRIHEQLVSGDIVSKGNGYVISPQGRRILRMYSFIADVFSIDKKNLSQ
jgi:hypothetical protein